MKKTIPLLIIIGIAAALCAAVLVTSLRADRQTAGADNAAAEPQDVLILVADRDMDAMTVLEAVDVQSDRVAAARAPHRHLGHTSEAVGKVLAVPVRKGQALTEDLFISAGTGVHLASTLRAGMRAMSVSLADYSGLEGLLYPGALVDVLATFRRAKGEHAQGEPVSASLMRGVMVLAVGTQSVVSEDDAMPGLGPLKRGRRRMVTVMVTPKQAEILQLAMEHGTISLSLRNPLDLSTAPVGGVTSMGELCGQGGSVDPPALVMAAAAPPPVAPTGVHPAPVVRPPWCVTIYRGGVAEIKQFAPIADTDDDGRVTSR